MEKRNRKERFLTMMFRITELLELIAQHKGAVEPPVRKELPVHVTVEWVITYLEIHRSNFYRNVYRKLIRPVLYVGRRPYYLRSDVEMLLCTHEPGAHTFSKLRKTSDDESDR
jgi:hypothetical protein